MSGMASNAGCPECCPPRGGRRKEEVPVRIDPMRIAVVRAEVIEGMQKKILDLFGRVEAHDGRLDRLEAHHGSGKAEGWNQALDAAVARLRNMMAEALNRGFDTRAVALEDAVDAIQHLRMTEAGG